MDATQAATSARCTQPPSDRIGHQRRELHEEPPISEPHRALLLMAHDSGRQRAWPINGLTQSHPEISGDLGTNMFTGMGSSLALPTATADRHPL